MITRAMDAAHHFGNFDEGGFDLLVEDMVRLSSIAKEETPGLPYLTDAVVSMGRRNTRLEPALQ